MAVALVLLYHGGFGWMSGGYVGVSVFFTLSGFLITSLALVEHERTGRLDVLAFYARRVRRLLPASLACIVGVLVLAATGVLGDVPNLRRDVWAALGQVYNWVALAGGDSYAELISSDRERLAPLEHYWSLAIEEQFYWIWPLVMLGVLRLARRGRAVLLGGLTLAAGVAAPVIARVWGGDAAYWATPARLGEILVGAATALAIHERRATGRRLPRAASALAPLGLAVIVWAAVAWPSASGPAYEGWLPVFALAAAALIVGLQVDGPTRRLLAHRPLVALGAVSYGVYLYHWPVFAVLDQERLTLARPALFAVRVAVTIALAALSAKVLEQPIRRAGWTFRPVSRWALAGCTVLAAAVVIVPAGDPAYWAGSEAERQVVALETVASVAPLQTLTSVTATPPSTTMASASDADAPRPVGAGAVSASDPPASSTPAVPASSAPPDGHAAAAPPGPDASDSAEISVGGLSLSGSRPPVAGAGAPVPTLPASMSRPARIFVLGDSTASAMGEGLVRWAADHPDYAQVTIHWAPGCGFVGAGTEEFEIAAYRASCDELRAGLAAQLTALQPDVVVLMVTIGDTEARALEPGTELLRPGDDGFATLIAQEYERFVGELRAADVGRVAWIVPPTPDTERHELAPNLNNPARWSTLRRVIEDVADAHPDLVTVIDLDAWEARQPESGRPDGLHFSASAATALADSLLAPTLIELALR